MTSYTVTGHPLNYSDLAATPGAAVDLNLTAALRNNGVGQTVNITLSGSDDIKAKGHNVLK